MSGRLRSGAAAFVTAIALTASSFAEARVYYDWPIGVEREVDEGFYMKVVANQNGWRVWRIETSSGAECRAIKSVRGQPHPVPVGVAAAFFRGTPNLMIYKGGRADLSYAWSGEHIREREVKIRKPNDKFWKTIQNYSPDDLYQDGILLQVNVQSWEYPQIYVGLSDETGLIDLTGLSKAEEAVRNCQ